MITSLADPGRTEQAVCQKHIDALLELQPAILGALVSSVDGFEVAARLRRPLSGATLAAMTSSQLALGQAISRESGLGACRNTVIESEGGRVLMMDIPNVHRALLLTVLADESTTLGQVLWAVKQCIGDIGKRLDAARGL